MTDPIADCEHQIVNIVHQQDSIPVERIASKVRPVAEDYLNNASAKELKEWVRKARSQLSLPSGASDPGRWTTALDEVVKVIQEQSE